MRVRGEDGCGWTAKPPAHMIRHRGNGCGLCEGKYKPTVLDRARIYGACAADVAVALTASTCQLCGQRANSLDIDHDHATGRARGAICRRCNIRLAALDDHQWRTIAESYLSERGAA